MTVEGDVALLVSHLLSCFGIGLAFGYLIRIFLKAAGMIR